ncbi:hypothetical protein D3C86_2010610 [compost metagenome]
MLSSVVREWSGYASGVLAVVRTFGQCLGAALVSVLLAVMVSANSVVEQDQAVRACLWLAVAASGCAIVLSLSRLRRNK